MDILFRIIIILIFLKALIIGSEFSFYHWIKDGRKYLRWYSNRSQYNS